MDAAALLDTLSRKPDDPEAWRLAALALGGSVRTVAPEGVGVWIDALARVAVPPDAPWVSGVRDALLALLSGLRQDDLRRAEAAVADVELGALAAAKPVWKEIALAGARSGGLLRTAEVSRDLGCDKATVSRALREMVGEGLVEGPRAGEELGDARARLYRLLPAGRRLAEIASPPRRVARKGRLGRTRSGAPRRLHRM